MWRMGFAYTVEYQYNEILGTSEISLLEWNFVILK